MILSYLISLFLLSCFSFRSSPMHTADSYFLEAILNLNDMNYEDALPFLRAAVRLSPKSQYLFELGKIEILLGIPEKGVRRFKEAISYNRSTLDEILAFVRRSSGYINDLFTTADAPRVEYPIISEFSLLPNDNMSTFIDIWDSNSHKPFIIRNIFSFLKANITKYVGIKSPYLSLRSEEFKTEFYPQNLLKKPTKVFRKTLKEALEYLDYPEGAYLTVDASEPGTICSGVFYHLAFPPFFKILFLLLS